MSQIQVKQIISSFCKILEYFNFTKVTPEDLRLAKFNKPDALDQVWRLLFELIIYLKSENKKTLDRELKEKFIKLGPEKTIRYIKEELMKLGYICHEFFKLSSFKTSCSSREVLIAIGWLVYTYEIIYIFIENSNCPLDEEYYKENALKKIDKDEFRKEFESLNSKINPEKNKDLLVQINNLRVLDGYFKSKINSLHSCLMEKAKLTYQAHSESSDRFSCLEIFLLKHPEKITTFEKLVENKIEVQKNILNWIKNEELFWTWMESVVDENISSSEKLTENESEASIDDHYLDQILNQNLKSAAQEYHNFEKNIRKIDGLVEDFKSRLKNDNKNELNEENLKELKKFENETIENFQKIINDQNFRVLGVDNNFFLDKFESRLFHVDEKSKKVITNNLIMLNDINNSIEQEAKYLEKKFFQVKNEATQICEELSSKLKDCYVVHK